MKFDGNKIKTDMKDYLESRVAMYNNISFIENDPVSKFKYSPLIKKYL